MMYCTHLWVKVENTDFARVHNLSYGFHTRTKQLPLIFTVFYKSAVGNVSLKFMFRNKTVFTTIHFTSTDGTTCVYNIHSNQLL